MTIGFYFLQNIKKNCLKDYFVNLYRRYTYINYVWYKNDSFFFIIIGGVSIIIGYRVFLICILFILLIDLIENCVFLKVIIMSYITTIKCFKLLKNFLRKKVYIFHNNSIRRRPSRLY